MKHPSWITLPALSTFFVGGNQRKPMTFSRELTNSSHVWSNFRCQLLIRTSNSHPQWWEAVMPGHWENHSGSCPENFITSSTEITLQYLVWLEGHLWWPFCSFWLSFAMLLLLAVFLTLYSLRQGWSLSAVWRHPLTPLCWHLEMFEISLLHSLIIE